MTAPLRAAGDSTTDQHLKGRGAHAGTRGQQCNIEFGKQFHVNRVPCRIGSGRLGLSGSSSQAGTADVAVATAPSLLRKRSLAIA